MTKPKQQTPEAVLRTWYCPFQCGWFRDFNIDPDHAYEIVYHPLVGYTTEAALARFDIASHVCEDYWQAMERLKNAGMQGGWTAGTPGTRRTVFPQLTPALAANNSAGG